MIYQRELVKALHYNINRMLLRDKETDIQPKVPQFTSVTISFH